jgi:hypothetical protein
MLTTDRAELNAMIGDCAAERGWSGDGVWPDLVGNDHDVVALGEEEGHRKALAVRRRTIAWLRRHPAWVECWRERQELNRRLKELCAAKGLKFAPWECPPWHAPDELPEDFSPGRRIFDQSLPHATRLRRRLIAELRAGM